MPELPTETKNKPVAKKAAAPDTKAENSGAAVPSGPAWEDEVKPEAVKPEADENGEGVYVAPDEPVKAEKPEPEKPAKKAAAKPGLKAIGGLGATLANQTTKVSALLYGPEGSGKTTSLLRMAALCGPDQRVLLIDAEGGAKVEALRQRGVDVTKIEVWPSESDGGPAALTFEGMEALADELADLFKSGDKTYIGGVWDSGSEITRRLLDTVTAAARDKDARLGKDRSRFQVNLEDHGVASSMLRELLRKYRDLPWHFVITALERRDIDNDTGQVKYGPAMSPAMANDCSGLVDIVGYTQVEQVGPNNTDVYVARFTPLARRRAKDRFGVLPKKMPDPFFDRIVAYVNGDLTRANDPVIKSVRELAGAATEEQAKPAE